MIGVTLTGTYLVAKTVLGAMVARGRGGKVVLVASVVGLVAAPALAPMPAYAAAKGAVVNLTRELAIEYASKGITVNTICPGTYRTNISGGILLDAEGPIVKAFEAYHPLGRTAVPEEIRGSALFLASSASDFMTGQMLVVDGGWTAR